MRTPRNGFTLLEILLALGIMGGALMAVAGAVDAGARRIMAARELLVASRLASAKLQEVIQVQDLADLDDQGEFEGHPGYRWKISEHEEAFEVAQLDLGEKLHRVTVLITWRDGDRSVEMVTRRPLVLQVLP